MDSVNYYAETTDSQSAEQNLTHRLADVPDAAQGQAQSCPLCRTLNHSLSRECFNCGWQGCSASSAAVTTRSPRPLLQAWLAFFRRLLA